MTLPKTGKLVRDRIPQIIEDSGKMPETCVVKGEDFVEALKRKLDEEVQELRSASISALAEEIADTLEVLLAIAERHGLHWEDIERLAGEKRVERGGFGTGTWLLGVASAS